MHWEYRYPVCVSLCRTFLFCILATLLGCQRGVSLKQFKRLEVYKTPHIELNVPQEFFPVKENEVLLRKLFGTSSQGKITFEMLLHDSRGLFLDPKGMGEGRNRMVIFNAEPAANGCVDRMKRIAEAAQVMGVAKTEIIAGKSWETIYSSYDRQLDFHRCERGVYWFLVFQDSKVPNRLALLAWAKPSVESAK